MGLENVSETGKFIVENLIKFNWLNEIFSEDSEKFYTDE